MCDEFQNRMQTSICSDVFNHKSAGDAEKHASRTLPLCPMNFLPGDFMFANAV